MTGRAIECGKDQFTILDEIAALVFGDLEYSVEALAPTAASGERWVIGEQSRQGCGVS